MLVKPSFIKKAVKKVTVFTLLFLYLTPWNLAFALLETTHTLPTDTSFNAEGYSDDTSNVAVSSTEVKLNIKEDWWNEDYLYKRNLTVRNIGTTASLASGTPIQATIDLLTLGLGTTKIQDDLDDLRIVYSIGSTHTEIARSYFLDTGTTSVATITFPLQTELGIGATNTNYSIYYGNSEAIYTLGSGYDFQRDGDNAQATMVCPFNGTTTCVDGETPTTETGAIRYSGATGSALKFNGAWDGPDRLYGPTLPAASQYTIEFFLRNDGNTNSFAGIYGGWGGFSQENLNSHGDNLLSNPGGVGILNPQNIGLNDGQWHHLAFVYDSTTFYIFMNGQLLISHIRTVNVPSGGFVLGFRTAGYRGFRGSYDELRISNVARYTEDFSVQTSPFETDDSTLVLYHFDENGDDPRNSGKAVDSSGNNNHGTITGAKYVGGLVGVDKSSTDTGAIPVQSTAGHNGVFIEEGTTNLITNPSFEHASFNTGWRSDYFNYDGSEVTFTPNVAKRNSAGPFAAGVMGQSSVGATTSGDRIDYLHGTEIKGDFSNSFDDDQGTVVFWWTPEYSSNEMDTGTATFLQVRSTSHLRYNWETDRFVISDTNFAEYDVVAGNTYLIVWRWDKDNNVKTNMSILSINNVTVSETSTTWEDDWGFTQGGDYDGIVEGLTIYRRPLWDGTYGVDVSNGDELTQIYNAGAGKDPTLVTGSWDVVFALPTNASTGSLGSGTVTGQAWSHPHASNRLYTSTTNTGGFMMGGDYTTDGWRQNHWSQAYGTGTTTFTANVSKRNSAGPFAQGVMIQGSWTDTATNADTVSFDLGSTVASSSFRQTADISKGTLALWVTPEWDGDEALSRSLYRLSTYFRLEKSNSSLVFVMNNGSTINRNISDWNAGETKLVIVRWDYDNPVSGSNHACITIDDSTTCGITSPGTIPTLNMSMLGYYNSSGAHRAANAIIEGLTVYRRPLWDGEYGIDVDNGDEIERIWNNGTGKDPTLVTGSWDVVFALPTNASAGSLGVGGTGQAWSHPHSSNVLYTNSTNTGGFMMGVGYTSDGWSLEGTPVSVEGLGTSEKIYGGGYKWTSNDYNQGIGYTLNNLTVGKDYVIRALANSGDGVGQPKIFIYDNTNGHDITSFVGTTASTRTDPDVMLFTFELPTVDRYASDANYSWVAADTTSITVKLVNASNTGSVYFHQVELLGNQIDNPSLEVGSTATGVWIPDSWSNGGMDAGEVTREDVVVHSGVASLHESHDTYAEFVGRQNVTSAALGIFTMTGGWVKRVNGSCILTFSSKTPQQNSTGGALQLISSDTTGEWKHQTAIGRSNGYSGYARIAGYNASEGYYDDLYVFNLTPVYLTITSTSLTNSTEANGVRVDGADEHTEIVNSNEILVNRGTIKFTFTPRHSFDISSNFGIGNPVIMQAYEDADNYIKLHKQNSSTLQLIAMIGGTEVGVGWTNPTLNDGTTYPIIISYESGGNLRLNVAGVDVGTTTIDIGTTFSTAPSTIYWGTDNGGGGSNPYDGTYLTNTGEYAVEALDTADKIFVGGYKTVSDGAVQGIGYTLSGLTVGADYVVRALAHSDTTSIPKISIWDVTHNRELTSLTGTNTSTRTNPDSLLFTFELPYLSRYGGQPGYEWVTGDTTAIEVRLLNTETSGTAYFHQVEVLPNLIDNPSMEVGSTATGPWVPEGWSGLKTPGEGDTEKSSSSRTGLGMLQFNTSIGNDVGFIRTSGVSGVFASMGAFIKGDGVKGARFTTVSGGTYQLQDGTPLLSNPHATFIASSDWNMVRGVYRKSGAAQWKITANSDATGLRFVDDVYLLGLSDVSLTVTPASEASSTESTGLRVDGADTATQPISGLSADKGTVKFTFTPRHNFDVGSSFGFTNPQIVNIYGDEANNIKIFKNGADLTLQALMTGTTLSVGYTNPTLNVGSSYAFEISYVSGGDLALKIDNSQVGSTGVGAEVSFGTIPTLVYFGSDNNGSNQYDSTFTNFIALTPSENTSSPYYRFGSKSIRLVNSGTQPDQYTIDVGASATNTLSAYVFNQTSGDVGEAVSSSVAELFYNNLAVGTTYTDTGGGWWRLTGSVTGIGTTVGAGVEVKSGKTVYVDGVQMEQKAYATTYADGNLGVGYSWDGEANNSISSRTVADLRYSINELNSMAGTISLWFNPDDGMFRANTRRVFYTDFAGARIWIYKNMSIDNWQFLLIDDNGTVHYSRTNSGYNTSGVGNWFHIVGTYDATLGDTAIYMNGVLQTGVEANQTPWTSNFGGTIRISTGPNKISDFRIFDKALTETEIASLYYTGLSTHSKADEEIDRYRPTGTYTSSIMDLGNNGDWGVVPLAVGQTVNNGIGETIVYSTRTSADNSSWNDWVNVGVGGSIGSQPLRYLQLKAELASSTDQSQTPELSSMVVSYVGDATAPLNPTEVASGYSSGVGTTELTSGTSNWYNYANPYFSWLAGIDQASEGQSSSGVDGYHVLLSQDQEDVPTGNLSSLCYAWVDDSDGESGGAIHFGSGELSSCTLSNGTYYLLIQTKDNSGNVATPSQLFTYQYDGSNPVAPTTVSSTTVGYSATNQFDFFWPTASDVGPAGIAGYEYKTGSTDAEDVFSDWQYTAGTGATNVAAYTEGQNFFYVRSVDRAGNRSATTTNLGVSPFYYNASAPTAPRNVSVSPLTNAASPASSNVFSVTWDKPETYSGEIAKYYYCVNCTPSSTTMTETTSSETVNRALTNLALATQQGKNTFYIVAEDNNINSETGNGNRNFEAYSSVDFWASTTAPGAPTNLVVTDASDRSNSIWRLTLTWVEPTTATDLKRYDVYRSTDNSSFTKLGEVSSTAYTDTGLTQSTTYYYKVYSVDSAGSNSLASAIVSLAPEGRYNEPPMAGGAPLVSAGSTTVILTWTTSRPAFGTVEYGKTSNYGSAASETSASTVHTVKLTGLASGETYHYRVQNLDDSSLVGYERGQAYSSDYTFTTMSSAEISEVVVEDTGLDYAIISWKTRTTSAAEVVYGKTLDYGEKVTVSTSAEETEHTVRLSSLEHSTTYHFKIKGVTVDSDDIESQDISFETMMFPKINAYVVKTDQSSGGTTVAAAWTTNKETTSVISYQKAELVSSPLDTSALEKMGQQELAKLEIKLVGKEDEVASNELTTDHVLRVGSLDDGSIYILRLKGRDESGNELIGDPIRYVTGRDTRPPVISNLSVESQMSGSGIEAKAQVLVSWETDEEATSQIIYGQGTGSDYPLSTPEDKSRKTRHIVVIRDLEANSSYHLKISSKDLMGNTSYSEDIIAVTPSTSESALDIVLKQLEDIFGFLRL